MARTKSTTDDSTIALDDDETARITTARDEAKARLADPDLDQEDRASLESVVAKYEGLLGA